MVLKAYKQILLVALGGPSSSGKTTCAKALYELLPRSIIVHEDDFYFPDDKIPVDHEKNIKNWDCPGAIDFEKFVRYITDIKKSQKFDNKIESLEIDSELKLSKEESKIIDDQIKEIPGIEDTVVVLVDGFMLYHDPSICKLFDVKLFFYGSFETLKRRRESRQGYNTVAGFWVDPPNYFTDIVWPEFVKNHKYLFENEDVNCDLNDYARTDLTICSYKNDVGTSLRDLVEWSLQQITHHIV
ncbi:uncharacterized protein PRCAT00001713001 [Priceomyces carsonii]|uniref:uncharacterized protein n=1 Tax=Priceomyces carsonii TaxID=28549 RepID=UPI002ED848BE|nr:unnamed protein product [Priceomyces carsonii]